MKQATRFLALFAIGIAAYTSVSVEAASARGSIKGFIQDGNGSPLVGAAVLIIADKADEPKLEKVIRRANTNAEGKFIASGISPGRYKVKAEAAGFKAVEVAADVKANKVTIFDSIQLRRINTLAEETSLNLDPKYASRQANRTIFHHQDTERKASEAEAARAVALTDRSPELHGFVNTFAQTTASANADQRSFLGANFAISEQLTRNTNIVVSGQAGYGEGAPQRAEVLTTTHAGDRHKLSVALGYARFILSRRDINPALGQFSLSATDTWQVSGPVLVVYGLEFARFTEGAQGTSVMPRFGIAFDASAHTRLFAGLVPGSSTDTQASINLESGEIVFSEPKPVAITADKEPMMDRSYRLQFGGEQMLSESSSVEMMAFFDTVSGHGVGLLAIPTEGISDDPQLQTALQRGRSRGLRVTYKRRINDVFDGTVGYAFGEGQRLSAEGITEPARLFKPALFHVVTARVNANFINTGTKVSTVLRLAPEDAVFAIDPFQGQIATFDPNISVSLTQELPSFGFVPGHWQALIDLRNLLDQQASVSDERQDLIAGRFNRLIRVGVSLRF